MLSVVCLYAVLCGLCILAEQKEQHLPSITIYTTLREFDYNKRAAVQSWLRLPQVVKVVLVGRVEYLREDAIREQKESNSKVLLEVDDRVDTNFLGRPLFNSLIYLTMTAETDIAIFVNADVHILPDVIFALNRVYKAFPNFAAMAARWDIDDSHDRLSRSKDESPEQLREWVINEGTLHAYGGVDLWAYNVNRPLLDLQIPHFVTGRGKYDNWFTHQLTTSERTNIDLTEAVTLIHRNHDRDANAGMNGGMNNKQRKLLHHQRNESTDISRRLAKVPEVRARKRSKDRRYKNYWSTLAKKSSFELYINSNLAYNHGSYKNQLGTALHAQYKMSLCLGLDGRYDFCILKRVRPGMCPCEFAVFSMSTTSDPYVDAASRAIICGSVSPDSARNYALDETLDDSYKRTPGIPHTLSHLLSIVAENRSVIMTAATYAYREFVMSFICNLRELHITNFVIAALDKEMYKYLYVRGIPVYFEDIKKGLIGSKENKLKGALVESGCDGFYSDCFKLLTKLKSRTMVQILRLGYHVLWSDSDIVWFKNPLPSLLKMASEYTDNGLLIVQSNEPDVDMPPNGIRRINSGFYLAMATPRTIEAFDTIISKAAVSTETEQPNFYFVLCGVKGEFREGSNQCFNDEMRVVFLDTRLYPNGAVLGIWNSTNIRRDFPDIFILHNNWIVGIEEKEDRYKRSGFTFYDAKYEVCAWNWTQKLPKR